MSLDEALDRTIKAYAKEKLHSAPTDVVAQNIGYKSANNGAALAAIAALRYYGLMVRTGEGQMAVSKSVEEYQFAPDDSHRRRLMIDWLKSPPVFADLLERYASGLPSDATLKFDLIKRGFNPASADIVILAFRKSVDFVQYFEQRSSAEAIANDFSNAVSKLDTHDPPMQVSKSVVISNPEAVGSVFGDQDDSRLDKIPVRLTGNRRAWLSIPSPFYSSDKKRLKAQIDLLLADDEVELS
jgi:hypothetical protein